MKAGDTLFLQHKHGRNQNIEIESVGRKWAKIKGRARWRLDLASRCVWEGDLDVGWCYESEATFDAECMRVAEWSRLVRLVGSTYIAPSGVTVEDMDAAAKLLKLEGWK